MLIDKLAVNDTLAAEWNDSQRSRIDAAGIDECNDAFHVSDEVYIEILFDGSTRRHERGPVLPRLSMLKCRDHDQCNCSSICGSSLITYRV